MDQRQKLLRRQQLKKARQLALQRKAKQTDQATKNKNIQRNNKRLAAKNTHVPNPLSKPDFNPDQYNKECYIVGGGPSLIGFNWTNLDQKFIIAINRAYEVLPNAQILYFTDDDYWQRHRSNMLNHGGKLYRGRIARKQVISDKQVTELQLQPTPAGWSDQYGELYHGSNSTYACIQLGAQLGFNKIFLLGIDMKHRGSYDRKKKNNKGVTHWHTGHRRTDPSNAYRIFMNHYQKMVPLAKERGIEIINVNTPNGTALKCFPIKTFDEVFNENP